MKKHLSFSSQAKNHRLWILALTVLMAGNMLVSCRKTNTSSSDIGYLPKEPDYTDSTQWYTNERNGVADVFYIVSTEIGDYNLPDGMVGHLADTYADSLRLPLYGEMLGVDTLFCGNEVALNFYAPYYRQCSLQTVMEESAGSLWKEFAFADVERAFDHFLKHINQGRPFVLAGFSQGALAVRELLRRMDDDTYQRMVAAYVIGYHITKADLEECGHIKPATGPSDTGVTVCYNSVKTADCAIPSISGGNVVAINPVNWRTDNTPATLVTEPSPLLPVNEQRKDTLTVRLDTTSQLLLVDGYTATDYVLPLFGKEGNYHTREIWLYRDCLKQNIAQRVMAKKAE